MQKTDEQLIFDYLEGNEESLNLLVDRYLNDAYRFAFSLTRDAHGSEDIVQESFTKAWKNIRKFLPGNSFQSWLFRIIRNTAIDFLRKKKDVLFSTFENPNESENMFIANLVDTEPLPNELLIRAENEKNVQIILENINPVYREVLTLRYTSNMTFDEMRKILKRPLHTLKSQHRRGLIAFRRLFKTQIV